MQNQKFQIMIFVLSLFIVCTTSQAASQSTIYGDIFQHKDPFTAEQNKLIHPVLAVGVDKPFKSILAKEKFRDLVSLSSTDTKRKLNLELPANIWIMGFYLAELSATNQMSTRLRGLKKDEILKLCGSPYFSGKIPVYFAKLLGGDEMYLYEVGGCKIPLAISFVGQKSHRCLVMGSDVMGEYYRHQAKEIERTALSAPVSNVTKLWGPPDQKTIIELNNLESENHSNEQFTYFLGLNDWVRLSIKNGIVETVTSSFE